MKEKTPSALRRDHPADIHVPAGHVRMLESHHKKGFSMKMDAWPFHKVCWVAMGKGVLEREEGSCRIRKDDFLILPAHWPHCFQDDDRDPLTLVMFCVSETYIADSEPERPAGLLWQSLGEHVSFREPVCAKTAFHHSSLVRSFRSALREQSLRNPGWEAMVEAECDRSMVYSRRGYLEPRMDHTPSSRQTVQGAIALMDEAPYEEYAIADLAERCSLSRRRFTDLFKQETGETFSTYLNHRRIEYACQRLKETEHIVYACHASGYNDLSYFYRVFRQRTGRTPGEYIRPPLQQRDG